MHTIKVTKIGDGWNIRAFYNGKLVVEYRCYAREDIGFACRQAMRDCDKYYTGGDEHTSAVRKRMYDKEKYAQNPIKPIRKVL